MKVPKTGIELAIRQHEAECLITLGLRHTSVPLVMWYTTHHIGIGTVHVSQCKYGTCVCVSRTQATRWMCKQGMELTRINNTYYYVCGVYRTFLVV